MFRPSGTGPFPALAVLHGCLGPDAVSDQRRVERYLRWGYAVLLVDSFGPRQIAQDCMPIGTAHADRLLDALGALDFLAEQPDIDPGRIAVVGFSSGAGAALSALNAPEIAGLGHHRFKAAVAYYPTWCPSSAYAILAPALILTGARDDWNPAPFCRAAVESRAKGEETVKLVVYAGAEQSFDAIALKGHPLSTYGRHFAYDASADDAAAEEMRAFLSKVLRH